MRVRRIAILIDGGFFLKRLHHLVPENRRDSAEAVADCARFLCKRHVQRLTGERFNKQHSRWLDSVYRLFFYDATPFTGSAHHPLENRQIFYEKTPEALFRNELFQQIRRQRKFALRLGKVSKESEWQIKDPKLTKKLLSTKDFIPHLKALTEASSDSTINEAQQRQLTNIFKLWEELGPDDLKLGLRQKGVDMRIGIDITTLTLKRQVDTIILITGDSDFVPAAKVARREGVEFLLDPMWQSVNDDLHEHVDGLVSAFPKPGSELDADQLPIDEPD